LLLFGFVRVDEYSFGMQPMINISVGFRCCVIGLRARDKRKAIGFHFWGPTIFYGTSVHEAKSGATKW